MPLPPRAPHPWLKSLVEYSHQKSLLEGKAVHAQVLKSCSSPGSALPYLVLQNSLINFYSKCDCWPKAKIVFDNIPNQDVVSWNCLINGCAQQGPQFSFFVIELFRRMLAQSIVPNAHTFSGVLSAASNITDTFNGQQIHALVAKMGSFPDVFIGSSLLNLYGKAGLMLDACKVFDRMPERNSFSWATMISGYAIQRMADEAFCVFKSLSREEDEVSNEFVFTSVLSSLTRPGLAFGGKQVHCLAVKNGLLAFVSVLNSLVTMYAKCGRLDNSFEVFEFTSDKNDITWSAMITGSVQAGDCDKALNLLSSMHSLGIYPSECTIVGILNACSELRAKNEGKQIHSYSTRLGFVSQLHVTTALVDMYTKCGLMADASKGFACLQAPDVVLWTTMISGYTQNGENEDALCFYGRMLMEDIFPNELTMLSVLKSCSNIAALDQGRQIHVHAIKFWLIDHIPIGSSLSAMYAKCGSMDDAEKVFSRMPERDIISWNSIISGLSHNGHGKQALELFNEMIQDGIKPDDVTFVNVLSACSHLGLLEQGKDYFKVMFNEYGIVPKVDHYACMVDVLTRAGLLHEAKEFIESACVEHNFSLWRILLCACRNYRNYELGSYVGEKLIELGSTESSAFVLLSSIYTAVGRLGDVERVRRTMRVRGVDKEPGCSWIELRSRVHVFVVGDHMHPQIGYIRAELRRLSSQMKSQGCHSHPAHENVVL